ncbi:hypothetical protein [Enterococcus sp. DIV0170]|uniref:hypothetical protein n=1 Tax=Enterococcus sp. DIV0170 TaxID=2774642 RepID=UPI003F24D852
MSNVSVLTTREIKKIMSQNRTLYLSYLIADKYISRYDDETVDLLKCYYLKQKCFWSQKSCEGTHVFSVELNFATNILAVRSRINTKFYVCHGTFNLSNAGDSTLIQFVAGLYVFEYERRLDEMIGKFKLDEPSSIDDYEYPF